MTINGWQLMVIPRLWILVWSITTLKNSVNSTYEICLGYRVLEKMSAELIIIWNHVDIWYIAEPYNMDKIHFTNRNW